MVQRLALDFGIQQSRVIPDLIRYLGDVVWNSGSWIKFRTTNSGVHGEKLWSSRNKRWNLS